MILVEERDYVCALCGVSLEFVPAPAGHDGHRHMRCANCSPAGWSMCLTFTADPGLLPHAVCRAEDGRMAFGKITKALAIPASETRDYTFFELDFGGLPPPVLTCSHAGDGTPAYKRASWHAVNVDRAERVGDLRISEAKSRQRGVKTARLIADHCVRSWRHVTEDGGTEPAPCTPDKVFEFLVTVLDADDGLMVFLRFSNWIQAADTFRPVPTDGDLGKS